MTRLPPLALLLGLAACDSLTMVQPPAWQPGPVRAGTPTVTPSATPATPATPADADADSTDPGEDAGVPGAPVAGPGGDDAGAPGAPVASPGGDDAVDAGPPAQPPGGACGVACVEPLHAVSQCRAGRCERGPCEPGWFDVDGDTTPGCESRCEANRCTQPDGGVLTLSSAPLAERSMGGFSSAPVLHTPTVRGDLSGAAATPSDSATQRHRPFAP